MPRPPIRQRGWRTKRKLPQIGPTLDWREEVERMLIEAGTDGIRQMIFTTTFCKYASATSIINHLEMLQNQQRVQKFTIGQVRGRPATVWRATTLILED